MYIQITDHCNMSCGHCGFSCSSRKKNFMSIEVFKKAISFADSHVTLGGGEPTTHPLFWDYLGLSVVSDGTDEGGVLVITNGKRTDDALRLARLTRRGVVYAELSLDVWHEKVSHAVIKAFEHNKAIRTVHSISRSGRGKNISGSKQFCICDDLFIDPHGNIFSCGCKKHNFGNVMDLDSLEAVNNFYYEKEIGPGECMFC